MRPSTKFSKGLFAASMLAGSLLAMSGCGPDYAIFKVTIISVTTPRNNIEVCKMTITDENGKVVMDAHPLPTVYGKDSSGATVLEQGCGDGQTKANIGTLSYSSSRKDGKLTFQVDALDNTGTVVQTGKSDATPAPYPPEISVGITIK